MSLSKWHTFSLVVVSRVCMQSKSTETNRRRWRSAPLCVWMQALIREQQGDRTYVSPLITGRDGDNGAVSGAFEMAYSGSRSDHAPKKKREKRGVWVGKRITTGPAANTLQSVIQMALHTHSHNMLYLKHTDSTAFPLWF